MLNSPIAFDYSRHAELDSASTYQHSPSVLVARWTLKQVQGDDLLEL